MVNRIKLKSDNLFFGGCYHHNHNPDWPVPLWKFRGFDSIAQHQNEQIQKWNSVCNDTSTVILLGDTMFHDPDGVHLKTFLQRINFGTLYLMPGNHTSGWLKLYYEALATNANTGVKQEVYPLRYPHTHQAQHVFFIPNYAEFSVGSQLVICSHYAIRSWNKMKNGSWMIHSHEHNQNPLSRLDCTSNGKIADVGYEALQIFSNGAPISYKVLKGYMDAKEIKSDGGHH